MVFPALAEQSTLKREVVAGLDILIVRELPGGVYFGEPRGIFDLPNVERTGLNTEVYQTSEIRRVTAVALVIAPQRGKKVCSVGTRNAPVRARLWEQAGGR